MSIARLTPTLLAERLEEARRTQKLHIGYTDLQLLPDGLVQQVLAVAPLLKELDLSSNQLTTLPDDLHQLQHLRVLRLKYNKFNALPQVLGRLLSLEVLELSGNLIANVDIPVLLHLHNLRELDLSGNGLTFIGEGLEALGNLQLLQVSSNRIEALPAKFGEFGAIIKLDASNNSLQQLPSSVGQLKKIQRMDLANNMLQRVPSSIGHLKTLKQLNLRSNKLDPEYQHRSEGGLSRFLEFLRQEYERERVEEAERLKPKGSQAGAWLEYACKAHAPEASKSADSMSGMLDNRCWVRDGHGLVQVGTTVYVFGGRLQRDGTKTADLHWITTERMEWHLQPTAGDKPSARDGHCMIYDPVSNRLVVFGGRNEKQRRLNDLHYLQLDKWTWHRVVNKGVWPTVRTDAAATHMPDGHMVLVAGSGAKGHCNDLYVLDLQTWAWEQIITTGAAPSPRRGAAISLAGNQLYVHGGRNHFALDDLFVLEMAKLEWSEMVCSGALPARYNHLLDMHADSLYLAGGFNQLGAPSDDVHRLSLHASARPAWVEVNSELSFNKCRTAVIFNGQLSLLQMGSQLLNVARKKHDEMDVAVQIWDVFRTARLQDLKDAQLSGDTDNPKNAKMQRINYCLTAMIDKMPSSFTSLSSKESNTLAYIEAFQVAFDNLYPQRRPLYIAPRNECGIPKLVCTTLRPTWTCFMNLYDIDGAQAFVTNYIAYEPLENPKHPPDYLSSPSSTLSWQGGDCFDIAMLLCSLLIGVGYDAYTVVGYAPLAVTLNDQSATDCPARVPAAFTRPASMSLKRRSDMAAQPQYILKPSRLRESAYMKAMEGQAAAEQNDEIDPEAEAAPKSVVDSSRQNLIHAWVLVLSGKREVLESVFIEPSTGCKYNIADSPYYGIEFLWNHQNYWVCMQMPLPHSDSRARPADINFNLANSNLWEYLFLQPLSQGKTQIPGKPDSPIHKGSVSVTPPSRSKSVHKTVTLTVPDQPAVRRSSVLIPGRTPLKSRPSFVNLASTVAETTKSDAPAIIQDTLDAPSSWVARLNITQAMLDLRCPKGSKVVHYRQCQHELYAFFGECGRWDGLTERLILYQDDKGSVSEVRETYLRRNDKLQKKQIFNTDASTLETFDHGRKFGLQSILTIGTGTHRHTEFFPPARVDGLVERIEEVNRTVERFMERDDRLVYRSVTYEALAAQAPTRLTRSSTWAGNEPVMGVTPLTIVKITENFSRSASAQADDEVAKRVFYISLGQYRLEYHPVQDSIVRATRTYDREGLVAAVQVDPSSVQPVDPATAAEDLEQITLAIKKSTQAVRASEQEIQEILDYRSKQVASVILVTPYSEITRELHTESDAEPEDETPTAASYLTAFLRPFAADHLLTIQEAQDVREKCLKALRDRMADRARVTQARHEEETAAMVKRQANYVRDREQMTVEEQNEREHLLQEAAFRIRVLAKRLHKHVDQVEQKVEQLNQRLLNDPRLSALHSDKQYH